MRRGASVNPFATRYHAGGAVPYLFAGPGPASVRALYDAFEARSLRGEIIGPHGSGKSTLLRAMILEGNARGHCVRVVTIPFGRRIPPRSALVFGRSGTERAPRVLCLDGAEQLARPLLRALSMLCRARRIGLLLTGHAPLGMPPLRTTVVDEEIARGVTERVLAACPSALPLVGADEVMGALARAGGNLRDALFLLYDLYEERWQVLRAGGG